MTAALLRDRLVGELVDGGHLTSPRWRAAFAAVPRENFVERFTVPVPGDTRVPGRKHDLRDPHGRDDALRAVYSDTTLLTRFDAGGVPVSSSSAPSLMAVMLEALDMHDGHTVLEIGTGTGYNAALLCHRLGADHVFSVDLDAELVREASVSLAASGYQPVLAAADGAGGLADHAPYDRLLATCGVDRVPPAWIGQVQSGGAILANVGFALVLLTVRPDGSADGPVLAQPAAFMTMRRDLDEVTVTGREIIAGTAGTGASRTAPMPSALLDRTAQVVLSLAVPGLRRGGIPGAVHTHVYLDQESGSWCRARDSGDGATAVVTEAGTRRLWDEITTALASWESAGRPTADHHHLTVYPDGDHRLTLRV